MTKTRSIVAAVVALALGACAGNPNPNYRFRSSEVNTPFMKVKIFEYDAAGENMVYSISCKPDEPLKFIGFYQKGRLQLYLTQFGTAILNANMKRSSAEDLMMNDTLCEKLTEL